MRKNRATMVHIRFVSADVSGILQKIADRGILIYYLEIEDELSAQFFVTAGEYKYVLGSLNQWGADARILNGQSDGISVLMRKPRVLLVAGLLLICMISLFLSRRVLFVQVEGNEQVPALKIQEVAADCGIRFWAKTREIRSEKIKNRLLEAIPELQWAGVNTNGCVAVIRVEEKAIAEAPDEPVNSVTSIVASNDGIIDSFTVTSGNGLCYVGQAVKEGQTLISGYTDCGIVIKAQQAKGEVYARTIHNTTVISPVRWVSRLNRGKTQVRLSLKIGKKLINFDKGSGISPATCVKMYEERYLTLPGGFRLPVSLVCRTVVSYETAVEKSALSQNECAQVSEEYLLSQLVAGRILREYVDYDDSGDFAVLTGQYLCSEMIGRTKIEQSVQGETNSD